MTAVVEKEPFKPRAGHSCAAARNPSSQAAPNQSQSQSPRRRPGGQEEKQQQHQHGAHGPEHPDYLGQRDGEQRGQTEERDTTSLVKRVTKELVFGQMVVGDCVGDLHLFSGSQLQVIIPAGAGGGGGMYSSEGSDKKEDGNRDGSDEKGEGKKGEGENRAQRERRRQPGTTATATSWRLLLNPPKHWEWSCKGGSEGAILLGLSRRMLETELPPEAQLDLLIHAFKRLQTRRQAIQQVLQAQLSRGFSLISPAPKLQDIPSPWTVIRNIQAIKARAKSLARGTRTQRFAIRNEPGIRAMIQNQKKQKKKAEEVDDHEWYADKSACNPMGFLAALGVGDATVEEMAEEQQNAGRDTAIRGFKRSMASGKSWINAFQRKSEDLVKANWWDVDLPTDRDSTDPSPDSTCPSKSPRPKAVADNHHDHDGVSGQTDYTIRVLSTASLSRSRTAPDKAPHSASLRGSGDHQHESSDTTGGALEERQSPTEEAGQRPGKMATAAERTAALQLDFRSGTRNSSHARDSLRANAPQRPKTARDRLQTTHAPLGPSSLVASPPGSRARPLTARNPAPGRRRVMPHARSQATPAVLSESSSPATMTVTNLTTGARVTVAPRPPLAPSPRAPGPTSRAQASGAGAPNLNPSQPRGNTVFQHVQQTSASESRSGSGSGHDGARPPAARAVSAAGLVPVIVTAAASRSGSASCSHARASLSHSHSAATAGMPVPVRDQQQLERGAVGPGPASGSQALRLEGHSHSHTGLGLPVGRASSTLSCPAHSPRPVVVTPRSTGTQAGMHSSLNLKAGRSSSAGSRLGVSAGAWSSLGGRGGGGVGESALSSQRAPRSSETGIRTTERGRVSPTSPWGHGDLVIEDALRSSLVLAAPHRQFAGSRFKHSGTPVTVLLAARSVHAPAPSLSSGSLSGDGWRRESADAARRGGGEGERSSATPRARGNEGFTKAMMCFL